MAGRGEPRDGQARSHGSMFRCLSVGRSAGRMRSYLQPAGRRVVVVLAAAALADRATSGACALLLDGGRWSWSWRLRGGFIGWSGSSSSYMAGACLLAARDVLALPAASSGGSSSSSSTHGSSSTQTGKNLMCRKEEILLLGPRLTRLFCRPPAGVRCWGRAAPPPGCCCRCCRLAAAGRLMRLPLRAAAAAAVVTGWH